MAGPIDADEATIRNIVNDAYYAKWGQPDQTFLFETKTRKINVHKWSGASVGSVSTYCTTGAAVASKSGNRRVELNLGIEPEHDEVCETLANAAMTENLSFLAPESTLQFGDDLWKGTPMTAFLLVTNQGGMQSVPLPDGTHVDFMLAIPIFDAEREYGKSEGFRELFMKFKNDSVRFWDPLRQKSVV